jgi:hypothetical protein
LLSSVQKATNHQFKLPYNSIIFKEHLCFLCKPLNIIQRQTLTWFINRWSEKGKLLNFVCAEKWNNCNIGSFFTFQTRTICFLKLGFRLF